MLARIGKGLHGIARAGIANVGGRPGFAMPGMGIGGSYRAEACIQVGHAVAMFIK